MMTAQRKEYAGIDFFRLIAAFLVIAVHTSPLLGLNETADFILTRVLARVAVPFFFMASSFFLFSKAEVGKPQLSQLAVFVKRAAILYGVAILFYLPLNIYTGKPEEWMYLPNFLKDIVFNGTLYHLWYLPAAVTGACITWLLLKTLKPGPAFIITLVLYTIGLFGDSYYGISENIPFLKAVYQSLFLFFDYTRNGLFFAPVFFTLGALLAGQAKSIMKNIAMKTCLAGLGASFALMLAEGLLLHDLKLQRHDSMYLTLLPCMFFLFQSLLLWNRKGNLFLWKEKSSDKRNRPQYLRSLSMLVYLIHPAVIVAVRGFAKAASLQELLVDNSVLHFLAAASGSFATAAAFVVILNVIRIHKSGSTQLYKGRAWTENKRHKDRAWVEINLSNLRHNVQVLRDALPAGCDIMAVVKANAYGHGAAGTAAYLNRIGIDSFAVATIDEGILLRRKRIKGEILILGYTPPTRVSELFRYRLSQTVADSEHARELNRPGKPIRVHIKVDTGMNRLGENYRHVSEIASIFDCKSLKVTGIFSHMCASDSIEAGDITFTDLQIQHFHKLLDELKVRRIQLPKIHLQSSYGVLNYPGLQYGYARIGIALYGVLSTSGAQTKRSLDLRPVLALKSKVILVRILEPGECAGYGREFAAQRETKIAIVSIGYADGFPRSLSSGKSHVLIRGRRTPVIGRICMDQLMVDATGLPGIKRGDVVTLIGRDGPEEITAEHVAEDAGTITNELLSRLSCRLERVFLD